MDNPELSYKKPSKQGKRDGTGSEPLAESLRVSSRKVSSRRRALQDFYKISEDGQNRNAEKSLESKANEPEQTTHQLSESAGETGSASVDFEDAEAVKQFLQLASINDILQVRNGVSGKLLSQELTKKSIIYDNYYELIKLRQILDGVSKSSIVNTTQSAQSALDDLTNLNSRKERPENVKSVEQILGDLKSFINKESKTFNADFNSVVSNITNKHRHLDSNASMVAIPDKEEAADVDSAQLTAEITAVLNPARAKDKDFIKSLAESANPDNLLLQRDIKDLES
jgi:hypothetical protein